MRAMVFYFLTSILAFPPFNNTLTVGDVTEKHKGHALVSLIS